MSDYLATQEPRTEPEGAPVARTSAGVIAALAELADPEAAIRRQRYFKNGPGQYGAGDLFIGVSVPATRAVVKRFIGLPLAEIDPLLDSPIHEHRAAGAFLLVSAFSRASAKRTFDDSARADIAEAYLAAVRRGRINNWDLVDLSAPRILGGWLFDRPREVLFDLAASPVLWERRVGILATYGFIIAGDAVTTLELCERLLSDPEDLMHRAVGWMLREVGKRVDPLLLNAFLDEHAARMPRVALSYATEHLTPAQRADYRARR